MSTPAAAANRRPLSLIGGTNETAGREGPGVALRGEWIPWLTASGAGVIEPGVNIQSELLLTNLETVPGSRVVEHYGLVSGNTVRAKNIGRDFMAGLKNIVGGELKGYTELLVEARTEAVERMAAQARELGANAVVNIRFSTSSVTAGAAELYAYGTAVKIEQQ